MKKTHLLTFALLASVAVTTLAQTPSAGSVGFTVKNAGAGSTTNWVPPGTPPKIFAIKPDGSIVAADPGENLTVSSSGVLEISGFLSASDLGTNVSTWLSTPTSANLRSAITDETGSGVLVFGTSPTLATPIITGAIDFADGTRQTFNPNGTSAGLNFGSQAGDPSTLINGDVWYNSSTNELKARVNGSTVNIGGSAFTGDIGVATGTSLTVSDYVAASNLIEATTVRGTTQLSIGGDAHLLQSAGGEFNIAMFPNRGGTVPLVADENGYISLVTEVVGILPVSRGGTGGSDANNARANLGLSIGSDVLAPNGSGASLTSLNASNIASGTVPTARLGSGTASNTTFLRGDGTWSVPSGTGGGITDLTGDVTASGTGSVVATLANSGVTAGDYDLAGFEVDAKGRMTSVSPWVLNQPHGIPTISESSINPEWYGYYFFSNPNYPDPPTDGIYKNQILVSHSAATDESQIELPLTSGRLALTTQLPTSAQLLPSLTGNAGKVLVVNPGETGTTWTTVSGSGTVTSVAISGSDGIEIDSGSPITTAGTIALGLNAANVRTLLGSGTQDNTTFLRGDGTWAVPAGGGGLTNITETLHTGGASGTRNTEQLEVINGTTSVHLQLTPKGNGGVALGPEPDATATGGNQRGEFSFDAQLLRGGAARIASGYCSFVAGYDNTASGNYTASIGYSNISSSSGCITIGANCEADWLNNIAMGYLSKATQPYSQAFGSHALADRQGSFSWASGQRATKGDVQSGKIHLMATTTNATPTEALSGGSGRLTLPSGGAMSAMIEVVGKKSDNSATCSFTRKALIRNTGGTITLVGSNTVGTDIEENASTDITISGDNTNKALVVSVTGIASETWYWNVTIDFAELR